MTDPKSDDALLAAAERAREAQARLAQTPPEDPAIVPEAHKVYLRAQEVDELAKDAAHDNAED
jgi:hypothetical protein